MAVGSVALLAYRWRQRLGVFARERQLDWVKGLRRAWLKNPRTLAFLQLEPLTEERDGGMSQVVAYRHLPTGRLLSPQEAGPRAVPVLVTTPKKVTKEYGKEILAAWPEAEVVQIERYSDVEHWLRRCAESPAPAVVGVFSHSTSRAFGRQWQPALCEKSKVVQVPDLHPDPALTDQLEKVRGERQRVMGYRFKESGEVLTRAERQNQFFCPDCGTVITAVPGKEAPTPEGQRQSLPGVLASVQKKEEEKDKEPVTNRIWFEQKPRWCSCTHRRNDEREERGLPSLRSPLWTDARLASTQRKYPARSFADWSAAIEHLRQAAEREAQGASEQQLIHLVAQDDEVAHRLIAAAQGDPEVWQHISALVRRYAPGCLDEDMATTLFVQLRRHPLMRERLVREARQLLHWTPLFLRRRVAALRGEQTPGSHTGKRGTRGVRLVPPSQVQSGQHTLPSCSFGPPPADSFSPYEYLYQFYRGCVALTIVDESHNGRGRDTDIAHAHHLAMLSAQTRELTSGTHYGGDILSFFYYWFRFHPQFWKRLGLGWNDASEALRLYGVIQEWTKEVRRITVH